MDYSESRCTSLTSSVGSISLPLSCRYIFISLPCLKQLFCLFFSEVMMIFAQQLIALREQNNTSLLLWMLKYKDQSFTIGVCKIFKSFLNQAYILTTLWFRIFGTLTNVTTLKIFQNIWSLERGYPYYFFKPISKRPTSKSSHEPSIKSRCTVWYVKQKKFESISTSSVILIRWIQLEPVKHYWSLLQAFLCLSFTVDNLV